MPGKKTSLRHCESYHPDRGALDISLYRSGFLVWNNMLWLITLYTYIKESKLEQNMKTHDICLSCNCSFIRVTFPSTALRNKPRCFLSVLREVFSSRITSLKSKSLIQDWYKKEMQHYFVLIL